MSTHVLTTQMVIDSVGDEAGVLSEHADCQLNPNMEASRSVMIVSGKALRKISGNEDSKDGIFAVAKRCSVITACGASRLQKAGIV